MSIDKLKEQIAKEIGNNRYREPKTKGKRKEEEKRETGKNWTCGKPTT